jgi:hypothetical protein
MGQQIIAGEFKDNRIEAEDIRVVPAESLTVFLGGAGMNADYQNDMALALEESGIKNVTLGNYSALFAGTGIDKQIGDAIKQINIRQIFAEEKASTGAKFSDKASDLISDIEIAVLNFGRKATSMLTDGGDMTIDSIGVIYYNQDTHDPIALEIFDRRGCKIKEIHVEDTYIDGISLAKYTYSGQNIKGDNCLTAYVLKANLPPINFSLNGIGVNKRVPSSAQFNLIGYSWGSVIAARTALYYAERDIKIDHLVLIGAPINLSLYEVVVKNRNIKNTIVINLDDYGDPIYAGMTDGEIIKSVYILLAQMIKDDGHFYYAPMTEEGQIRRRELAKKLYNAGLR